MKLLGYLAVFVSLAGICYAATIPPKYHGPSNDGAIEWNQVNNDDTTGEAKAKSTRSSKSIKYEFFIDGTDATVDLQLQSGKTSGSLKDIDTDLMPDGIRFNSNSTNFSNVCIANGNFVDILFNSAGSATQDIDIWLTPIGVCD